MANRTVVVFMTAIALCWLPSGSIVLAASHNGSAKAGGAHAPARHMSGRSAAGGHFRRHDAGERRDGDGLGFLPPR